MGRYTNIGRNTNKYSDRQVGIHIDTQIDTQIDRQVFRQIYRQIHRQIGRYTDRYTVVIYRLVYRGVKLVRCQAPRRLKWRLSAAARMGQGPSAAARTGWGGGLALRLGQAWEVVALEIAHLGSCYLRKYLLKVAAWENAFGKVTNISILPCNVSPSSLAFQYCRSFKKYIVKQRMLKMLPADDMRNIQIRF